MITSSKTAPAAQTGSMQLDYYYYYYYYYYCYTTWATEDYSINSTSNRPFPSCCLSRFRSESWCSTIEREMSLICIRIRNSLPFEWLCTTTRFKTETCSNSEMGYCNLMTFTMFNLQEGWSNTKVGFHFQGTWALALACAPRETYFRWSFLSF